MAQFHSLSFAKWGGDFIEILKTYPFLTEGFWKPRSKMDEMSISFIDNTFEMISMHLEVLNSMYLSEKIKSIFETDKLIKKMDALIGPCSKYPQVISHGDMWKNNILFKFLANGQVEELKFIDFQASKVSSRIFDLSFFLYTSLQDDVINNSLEELLAFYYLSFNESVNLIINKPLDSVVYFNEIPLTFELFKEEWNELKFTGLAHALFLILPMSGADTMPDLESMDLEDYTKLQKSTEEKKEKLNSKEYQDRAAILFSRILNIAQNHLSDY